ncbi:MAG: hypothetical protein ACFFDY_13450 [Candidatus Thorarchaeota archaeon]
MLRKRYQLNWMFECPDAVLTCSILKCKSEKFLVFGGHDKTLYLMDSENNILDERTFDGWCRCTYPVDLDGDGCDEILVGAGDGNFMIMKLNIEKKKLAGLMRYKSSKRINCCIAGDFTQDGNIEMIFGSEDKTIKIFDNIKAKEPKYIFYYDSWVISCTLGFLNFPDEKVPVFALLVGTKNGTLQLIQFRDDMPEITWQNHFNAQINDIKIGDVTNDGLNEIILATDDSFIKILNSNGDLIKEIIIDDGRPVSLLIEDIDGDMAKEIVAGCADGSLKVFHNQSLNSQDFELKWKTKVASSIKNVCCISGNGQKLNQIVFGGYDRRIRNVTDFEWGQKETLDIPKISQIPETQLARKDELINQIAEINDVPTNIREHIFNILQEKGHLKDLMKDLSELGYSEDEILEEFTLLKTQKSVVYEKVTYPVWSLPEEEIQKEISEEAKAEVKEKEQPKPKVQPLVIEKPVEPKKEKLRAALETETKKPPSEEPIVGGGSLEEIIIAYLRDKKSVETKAQFVNDIKEKGFSNTQIEKEIALLKEQGKIQYSRAKPKGWSLVE